MNKWKNRILTFMYGRYGTDDFNRFLMAVWFAAWLLSILSRSAVFSLLAWACLIYMIFRSFSRNLTARRLENEKFKKIWSPCKTFWKRQWLRVKECRTHVYRTCPQCRANLRFPRKKGEHSAVCPCCQNHFTVHIRF